MLAAFRKHGLPAPEGYDSMARVCHALTLHRMTDPITLKRSLSLPLLTFYGLGTILGAGIYVLVGKVAVHAGAYVPVAFLVAALLTVCAVLFQIADYVSH
jgi:amino acid permease